MIQQIFIVAFMFAFANAVFAQQFTPTYPPPPARFTIQRPAPSNVHPVVEIETGTTTYPILAMPRSEFSNARVDGTKKSEDVSFNQGVTLGITVSRHDKTLRMPYNLGIGGLRASSPPGGGLATPSTYSRLFLFANTEINTGLSGLSITPGVEARRSMYNNVDSGHYVDAVLIKSTLRYQTSSRTQIEAGAGVAPIARFGISRKNGKSGTISNSKSTMNEINGALVFNSSVDTSFQIGASQENTSVQLNDYQGYRAYGLPAVPAEVNDEAGTFYRLTVRQFKIGATKHF